MAFAIANSPPVGAGITLDANHYIDINPTAGYTGTVPVEVQVTDTGGLTDTTTFDVIFSETRYVYLPLILREYPPVTGPAGFWEGPTVEFYVTPDKTQVERFAIYVDVSGCGSYKITRFVPATLVNSQFAFTGSYYASGTLHTNTSASGQAGLDSFYITGCGFVSTSGPFGWTATWQDDSQPTSLAAQTVRLGEVGAWPEGVVPIEGQMRPVE